MSDELYFVRVDVSKTYYLYVRAGSKDEAIEAGEELYYDLEPNYDFVDVFAEKEYGEPNDRFPTWAGGAEGSWE